MSADVEELLRAAGQSANAGRLDEAERLWHQVLALDPQHPQAPSNLGMHALLQGDADKAYKFLCMARNRAPDDLVVLMALSNACRQRSDTKGECEAIDAALAVNAYFLPAMLAKARWLEQFGTPAAAAATYTNALKIAPPESQWPATLRSQLEHARNLVECRSKKFSEYLTECLAPLQESLPRAQAARWKEAASIHAGRSKTFNAESNQMHIPRLPAIPFFDRTEFPSVEMLERKTDIIREELLRALQFDRDRFTPYVAYNPGEPVNQWEELNHSSRWSAFHLWRAGSTIKENLDRCPETAKALAEVGMVNIDGLCPNAMFSALAPKTHIPPHNGETNARLVAHLPLVVPDGCRFRVGFEERKWEVGEVLIFDDTIEHEASNQSDDLRVVLIFDLWNPLLTLGEREMVNTLATATREFKRY